MISRAVGILALACATLGAQGTTPPDTGRKAIQSPGLAAAPSLKEPFAAPAPVPAAVTGFRLLAEFDVREDGKIVDFKFTPTADRDYNRRIEAAFKALAFKPATDGAGKPVRGKIALTYIF